MGYPSMYLDVPDAHGFVFPQRLPVRSASGLGDAIGAAIARPDRLTVAAVGDGGAFMALAELETAARLKLTLLVLIYDDAAYGAEVHHFEPMGTPSSWCGSRRRRLRRDRRGGRLPSGVTVAQHRRPRRRRASGWPTATRPLVLDAKVNPTSAPNGSRRRSAR